jgi:serine/threonine protein kinase/Flp pilus assembly protein TadD
MAGDSLRSALHSLAASVRLSVSAEDHPLATELAAEMAVRWRNGERPLVEEFLERHPELYREPEAALRLIYEEFCLRQEHAEELAPESLLARFPQWRPQLEVLIDCHKLLDAELTPPRMPQVGDVIGEFRLVSELGRGAVGCVFLATQPELADRPMVLKVSPGDAQEHLSLARLQHTNIVPLYWAFVDPERHLRVLCMPYFGGATLMHVLDRLHARPPDQRSGKDLIEALDMRQSALPSPAPSQGPLRAALRRLSYVQAICAIGAALADALEHAHARGLVHLDLKPSNVLLAADAEPMLLDFHLARAPLRSNEPPPDWLGGTPDYLSPEQRIALESVRKLRPLPADVDGRSDIFSLGLVLCEALNGEVPIEGVALLRPGGPISSGLAAIIGKCLQPDPRDRYPSAGDLARDLRRHLSDQPLLGASEGRSERLQKWRRRNPAALGMMGLKLAAAVLLVALAAGGWLWAEQCGRDAEAALAEARDHLQRGDTVAASAAIGRGRELARLLPWRHDLPRDFDRQQYLVQRAQVVRDLHTLADRLRFLVDTESLAPSQVESLEASCRAVWQARERLLRDPAAAPEPQVSDDLLDVALLGIDLHYRRAAPHDGAAARRDALTMLDEVEAEFGPSPVLERERQTHAAALGRTADAAAAEARLARQPPRSAWEHYAVGRALLSSGHLKEAALEMEAAVALQPQGFWGHFYQGSCAFRLGQARDAIEAFHVCIALAPDKAEVYCNRGVAYAALGQLKRARQDYDRALALQPTFAAAALNRGLLRYRQHEYDAAADDLQRALTNGADPVTAYYNLALVHWARKDRAATRASVEQVLQRQPDHAEARKLLAELKR